MVEPDHPCIALPCACSIAFVVGAALAALMTLFTPDASGMAAGLILVLVGGWFSVIAGIWHGSKRTSNIGIGITVASGWFLLAAGIYGFMSFTLLGIAVLGGIILTASLFFVSHELLNLNPRSFFPLPYYGRAAWPTQDTGYDYYKTDTVPSEPRYWGSLKGLVVRSIVEARTPLTLEETMARTGLQYDEANTAIQELLQIGALKYESDQRYSVDPVLYHDYRSYLEETW